MIHLVVISEKQLFDCFQKQYFHEIVMHLIIFVTKY